MVDRRAATMWDEEIRCCLAPVMSEQLEAVERSGQVWDSLFALWYMASLPF